MFEKKIGTTCHIISLRFFFSKNLFFTTFLDDSITALNERFLPDNETTIPLQCVLTYVAVEKPYSFLQVMQLRFIKMIAEAEYELWQANKRKSTEEKLRPSVAVQVSAIDLFIQIYISIT